MDRCRRKHDRRSPLTSSSPELRKEKKKFRHDNRKILRDGGDGFEPLYYKHSTHQSRHPHHKERSFSRSASRRPSVKIRRSSSSDLRHSRHCKCHKCESRHHKELSLSRSSSGRSSIKSKSSYELHHSRHCKCRDCTCRRHRRRSLERCPPLKRSSYLKSYVSIRRSPSRNKSSDDDRSRYSKYYDSQKRRVMKKPSSKNSSSTSNSSPILTYDSRHDSRDTKNKHHHGKASKRTTSRSPSAFNDSRHFITHSHTRRPHPKKEALRRSLSKRSSSEITDYRHSKCRNSRNHHSDQFKRKPAVSKKAISRNATDSSDSLHSICAEAVSKKRKLEERHDVVCVKECQNQKSYSLKDMSINFLEKSERYIKENNLEKALNCINIALQVYKEEDKLLSALYSRRGSIHSLNDNPRCSFQGFLDFERAYIIDQDNSEARENMSQHFFIAANKFFRRNEFKKALGYCKHALDLNANNADASFMLNLIEVKLLDEDVLEQTAVEDKEPQHNLKVTSPSKTCTPEKLSSVKNEQYEAVCKEVKRLNKLIAEALKTNNFEEALKYNNLALRLFHGDGSFYDEKLYSNLRILKQQLLDSIE